jgi:hypothetical protein
MIIKAIYHFGIDVAKDRAAFAIAEKYGAQFTGSGCWLHEPFDRDLEWNVAYKDGKRMMEDLQHAGFTVYGGDDA